MAPFSQANLDFFINHLFLPPKLPQTDDQDVGLDEALLRLVTESLGKFVTHLPLHQQPAAKFALAAIKQITALKDTKGMVDQAKLLKVLGTLDNAASGTVIPLHIVAQNAGVIISNNEDGVYLEVFELSATHHAIMSTQGRLQRCFPGFALKVPHVQFNDSGLQATLAKTLSTMSFQEAIGMVPTVSSSQNEVQEPCDTTHPGLVAELVFSLLAPFSAPSGVKQLWKNTRDVVLWQDAFMPWRRSALWLHLRVVMQLLFDRHQDPMGCAETMNERLYKLFMLFLLATVLQYSQSSELVTNSEVLHCMSAKIVRRMLKLGVSDDEPGITWVKLVLKQTESRISREWAEVQDLYAQALNLTRLKSLEFDQDVTITLPELDAFLARIPLRASLADRSGFSPSPSLMTFPAAALPAFCLGATKEYQVHNLSAFEQWVALHLRDWFDDHKHRTETCGALKTLMQDYHKATREVDPNNPEGMSIMILTILELWMACDESALLQFPLLRDYDPGVPFTHLQCLLLPTKEQLLRLQTVESYLEGRCAAAQYDNPGSIFVDFGTEQCFSVRYFDNSHKHQELHKTIETTASEQRRNKCEELNQKKTQYNELMRQYNSLACQYTTNTSPSGASYQLHFHDCQKCHLQSQAESINIKVHEWPLPNHTLQAKSVVFELNVPRAFRHWRDASMYLIHGVLGSKYDTKETYGKLYSLEDYSGLYAYFRGSSGRVGLFSRTKSHTETHRSKMFSIPSTTTSDVCVNNGLQFRHFDHVENCFVSVASPTDIVEKACTYQLPPESSALQEFLFRSFEGLDSTPNEVISTQSQCPRHLSLAEFRSLVSIPVGYRLQWQNILRQLVCPTVDFKKLEASLVILQSIYQTGPLEVDDFRRAGHCTLSDRGFADILLNAVGEALRRIEENWESLNTLNILIAIVARQLTLSSSTAITSHAMELLIKLRSTAFRWVQIVKRNFEDAQDQTRRTHFMAKLVEVALICCGSFNIDDKHLADAFLYDRDASIFIQCSILIHDYYSQKAISCTGSMGPILYRRWQQLSYWAYKLLARAVVQKTAATGLDDAMKANWPSYHRGDMWTIVADNVDYWLVSHTDSQSARSLRVQYNVLTGSLLVNGHALTRLPSPYEQISSYQNLFGDAVFEIVPSSVAGMQYCSQRLYHGQSLEFGLDGAHLLLQATKDNQRHELIQKDLLCGRLPDTVLDESFQWYNCSSGDIEFRDAKTPWSTNAANWRLVQFEAGWRLVKPGMTLIDPASRTGKELAIVFATLQPPLWMSASLVDAGQTLEIELPKLQLNFHLKQGTSSIVSRKQRGFQVDSSQSIGTLVGLKTKLVLRNVLNDDRKVIIPAGDIWYQPNGNHVSVFITPTAGSPHVYEIDEMLKKLGDNGSLQSKLYLCYLHGLTSYCLPDPLTCRTGTEQALRILKSAAVRSFPVLSSQALTLLEKIDSLTPRRAFYPPKLRVMETVEWNSELPTLSQHPHFHIAVKELFKQHEMAQLYYPEEYENQPKIDGVNSFLLARDSSLSSTFRISGFGAEDFLSHLDVTYSARDSDQSSQRAKQARNVSEMLFHGSVHMSRRPSCSPDLAQHILKTLKSAGIHVNGPVYRVSPAHFGYDAKWLEGHSQHWANLWCGMHQQAQISVSTTGEDRFPLMMWFATMAFAPEADLDMIHTALAMFLSPEMQTIRPHSVVPVGLPNHLSVNEGDAMDLIQVRSIINMHCFCYGLTSDSNLPSNAGETLQQANARRQALYTRNQNNAIKDLLDHVSLQFPACELGTLSLATVTGLRNYINLDVVMSRLRTLFRTWNDNHLFTQYLRRVEEVIHRQSLEILNYEIPSLRLSKHPTARCKSFINTSDLLRGPLPQTIPHHPRIEIHKFMPKSGSASLVTYVGSRAVTALEQRYAQELRQSQDAWWTAPESAHNGLAFDIDPSTLHSVLEKYLSDSQKHVENLFNMMVVSVRDSLGQSALAESLHHSPRISPSFLLQQLCRNQSDDGEGWYSLSEAWQAWIVAYGIALTGLQRAKRLVRCSNNRNDLARELQNEGHTNWDPAEYPESLLIEVESNILIRDIQEEIASQMRSPPNMQNAVMQLNMGEGKSSVIVPIVTAALADGSRLVRVVVAKAQSRQMFQMLLSKLGGLLNRRLFHLPFSRALPLTEQHSQAIFEECRLCMKSRGVMLVQPEHILSFKLMGLESLITGNEAIGRSLLQTQHFFDTHSRDIVDESDENFSVKFELIYTMGKQNFVDFAPDRWVVVQTVLDFIKAHAPAVKNNLPLSIEVSKQRRGGFPRIRFLKDDAAQMLLHRVAMDICVKGFPGFPISRQPSKSRQAVMKYITEKQLSPRDVQDVERSDFWTDDTQSYILLLRGLFAKGILSYTFGQKRWRVNYGLDSTRHPPTKLAVPYRAKDSPSPRSEFSHPDVVITLTCNCYYYGGLDDENLFLAFDHLVRSDQANDEYQSWVTDSDGLPHAFRQLMGVNLNDTVQCRTEVFPPFRYAKHTIDYFLQYIVFPKHMKEFPKKLSASGWDLAAVKRHPTTGFSGTIDSKSLLPLDVHYIDLPKQKGTNAQVLNYLLRSENEVILLPPREEAPDDASNGISHSYSDAEDLLNVVIGRGDPNLRVILDVGAQVLELTNAQLAKLWLQKIHAQDASVQAVIYFDDKEEMVVLDCTGSIELFWTSPYAHQLDTCLVFLDEAHTRGTDIKLPQYYRAAVTLGANLTKDRLVQACMRMRKLGKGQSVVFCVPQEIQTKIYGHMLEGNASSSGTQGGNVIGVLEVLSWAIGETIRDIKSSIPLWATQGKRYDRQNTIWEGNRSEESINMPASKAVEFMEKEAQTVEHRYRPRAASPPTASIPLGGSSERILAIEKHCTEVGVRHCDESNLEEEQERELSPEVEEERQIERPPPADPAMHSIHPAVWEFVRTGRLRINSRAFMPAFNTSRDTTAATYLAPSEFPRGILVTTDFAKTVKVDKTVDFHSDPYQRPVQWILSSQPRDWQRVVIISPHEAQELLPEIQKSGKTTLHIYAPRPSQEFSPLDNLDLYTVSALPIGQMPPFPPHLKAQLNLFAGQLYFSSMPEYIELCNILRLSPQEAVDGTLISADGFIRSSTSSAVAAIIRASTFKKSPVKFLKIFLTKARRDCQSIEKTHLGKMLDGALLQERDFES